MQTQPHEYLDDILAISKDAAAAILEIYAGPVEVDTKQDGSPLTAADRAAHDLICERLSALTPDVPILSEESTAAASQTRAAWQRLWLVDPLDGTHEFLKRSGEFTINIALIENHRPVLGVVYVPVSNIAYSGCAGLGAFKESGGMRQTIHARARQSAETKMVISGSHGSEELAKYLECFQKQVPSYHAQPVGSAIKLCLVAEGAADLYPRPSPTWEWDIAAGQCVLEAAGGRVVDCHGAPLKYNKASLLNPGFIASGPRDNGWHTCLTHI